MEPDQTYTLEEFIIKHVATEAEWHEWLRVRDAKPSKTRAVMPTKSWENIYHEQLPPSKEFVSKEELRIRLIEGVRKRLLDGEWEAWARTGAPTTRQKLERVDLEQAKYDFAQNSIGGYRHVEVRRARPESNTEVLKRFIEKVCFAAGQPGIVLTKDVIRELARHLRGESFSTNAFAAAWDEAQIETGWRRAGPRRRKSIVD